MFFLFYFDDKFKQKRWKSKCGCEFVNFFGLWVSCGKEEKSEENCILEKRKRKRQRERKSMWICESCEQDYTLNVSLKFEKWF